MSDSYNERLVEKTVTYSVSVGDQFYVVENVPARVNEATGEQFFSPDTVEYIQELILGNAKPKRFLEVPVYQYS